MILVPSKIDLTDKCQVAILQYVVLQCGTVILRYSSTKSICSRIAVCGTAIWYHYPRMA